MRALALSLLLAGPALARPIDRPQAQALFSKGEQAFRAGEFEQALRYFEAARALDPAPVLTYNIARAHEEMGAAQAAIDAYEAYLRAAPDAEDRPDVERRIRVMRAIVDRAEEPAPPPPGLAPGVQVGPVDAGPPAWRRPVAYGLGGLGAVLLGGAVYFGVQANDAADAHRAAPDGPTKDDEAEAAERAAGLANLGYGVGGALLIGGVVLYLLDLDAAGTALVPTLDGVGIRGRF